MFKLVTLVVATATTVMAGRTLPAQPKREANDAGLMMGL
jgi:hypothetical protein